MTEHTLKSYDAELRDLRSIVSRMGGLAEEQLVNAMKALRELDTDLAENVRASDKRLDAMEIQAEQAAMVLFARRAPVADDLREVVASLKMTTLIERMGDYAKNIARRAVSIKADAPIDMPPILNSMLTEAQHMVRAVMDAYAHHDVSLANRVWEHDETLDNLHNAASVAIIEEMIDQPKNITSLTHMLMIAKNLERVGDQATNVAEQVHYAITGTLIEVNRPKNDLTSDELTPY